MRKYLRKRENGSYYIAEGYNIVGTPGELIGKGGGLWSRHTPACIAEMVG